VLIMALTFASKAAHPARHNPPAEPVAVRPALAARPAPAATAYAPLSLEAEDFRLLCALAALQLRYGKPQEAAGYLMALRRMQPRNQQVLRLLAISLMKLERWPEAEQILDELDAANPGAERALPLWRSLIRFRTNRLAEAREWFHKFIGWRD
jgi:predicted Zn-dependent protease